MISHVHTVMVTVELLIVTSLSLVALALSTISLLRDPNRKPFPAQEQDITHILIDDLTRKLGKLEGRLVDVQVRLDVLDIQVNRLGNSPRTVSEFTRDLGGAEVSRHPEVVISHLAAKDKQRRLTSVGATEMQILNAIARGEGTPVSIRRVVGRSREHISRVLKRLYEGGFVERSLSRPYSYLLTDRGRSLVSKSP